MADPTPLRSSAVSGPESGWSLSWRCAEGLGTLPHFHSECPSQSQVSRMCWVWRPAACWVHGAGHILLLHHWPQGELNVKLRRLSPSGAFVGPISATPASFDSSRSRAFNLARCTAGSQQPTGQRALRRRPAASFTHACRRPGLLLP